MRSTQMSRPNMTIKMKLTIFLSLLFLTAVGNAVFIFVLDNSAEKKLVWVNHTHEVILTTEYYLSAMQDTEIGQRGFLLTENVSYLEPYYRGTEHASKYLKSLQSLTVDNEEQQERLVTIESLMASKLEELQQTINFVQDDKRNEALDLVNQNIGKEYMDGIRREVADFISAELVLLEKRKGNHREQRAMLVTVIVVEVVFFIFLAILTISFLDRLLFSPLKLLLRNTRKMEEGEKLDISDLTSKDEMGYLMYSFFKMNEKVYHRTEELDHQARHDKLTGLLNRANVLVEIENAVVHARESGTKAAVLFLDLNKFKEINDTLGHEVGDAILKAAASRLLSSVRSADLVFRVGGDEFLVLINDVNSVSDIEPVITKILKAFSTPVMIHGEPVAISTSIGVAVAPDNSEDPEELVKMSDVAMYQSKQDKESLYELFEAGMLKRSKDKN